MTRHGIWIRFSAATDASERSAILGALIALGDHLGHVDSIACGADAQARAAGYGHAFVVTFETAAARDAYRALPEYAAVMDRLAGAAEGGSGGVRALDPDAG